jgi:membrane protease YdiL (CAAX protease family)
VIGRPPGTLRVLRLLAHSALLRILRAAQIAKSKRVQRRATKPRERKATPRKSGNGLMLLMVLMMPLMLFSALQTTARGTTGLAEATANRGPTRDRIPLSRWVYYRVQMVEWHDQNTPDDATARQKARRELADQLANSGFPDPDAILAHYDSHGLAGFEVRRRHTAVFADPVPTTPAGRDAFATAGALLLLVLTVLLVALGLGGANLDLGRPEWSFPWLLTFPVPTHAIVLGKVAEYSLVSFFPWFTVFPLTWQMLRAGDLPGLAWPVAIAATLGTAAVAGSVRFLAETWLRLRLPIQRVRKVQGACTLVALGGMATAFSVVMPETTPKWFVDLAAATPAWLSCVGTAWPMALLTHGAAAWWFGPAVVVGLVALATFAAARLLRGGAERTAGVDSGHSTRRAAAPGRKLTVLGKDLLLLARDSNFAVQTLIVPLFVLGLQLFLNRGAAEAANRGNTVILSYLIGSIALTGGCFAVLSYEGRALWLLFCQPVELHRALRQKVLLWACVAIVYTAIALSVLALVQPPTQAPWRFAADSLCVLAGVFSAAWLAAGIGALGIDPAADHVPKQPKARYVYLYLYLAGSYCLGLASDQWTTRAASLLVFGTLAWSLWQRVGDRLPWLLDPGVPGRREISAYDAGAAVTTFFLLQGAIVLIAGLAGAKTVGMALFLSYAIAGAVTVAIFVAVFASRGLPTWELLGLTTQGRRRPWPGTAVAALAGGALGAVGLGWQHLLLTNGWVDPTEASIAASDRFLVALLAVVAAPICEEILFRGMLFPGLLRSVPRFVAIVWSALLFAVVHPVAGWPPVFLLGIATAATFSRTAFLPAAMALHAAYNLVVVLGS